MCDFFPFPESARAIPWQQILDACQRVKVQIIYAVDLAADTPEFWHQIPDGQPVGPFEYPDAAYAHAYFFHGLGEESPTTENEGSDNVQ